MRNSGNARTLQPDRYASGTMTGSGRLPFPAMAGCSPREITVDRLTSGIFKANVLLRNSHADSDSVYTVQFSPDDQILAAAGYEGKVKLWKAPDWIPHGTLTSNGTISDISFSPDSSTLAATSYKSIHLWTVDTSARILLPSRDTQIGSELPPFLQMEARSSAVVLTERFDSGT